VLVGDGCGVKLFDQTGQRIADLAGEDHRDWIGAVASDQATFLARGGAGDVERVELRDVFAHLRAGLERLARRRTGHGQHGERERSHNESLHHRSPFIVEKPDKQRSLVYQARRP
ncbi:MAG TPA: hypothetical protein VEL76_08080, partial [Gemmataceae bacterium]|nr:hypothetical protein [Gemmataceae bacterium]